MGVRHTLLPMASTNDLTSSALHVLARALRAPWQSTTRKASDPTEKEGDAEAEAVVAVGRGHKGALPKSH